MKSGKFLSPEIDGVRTNGGQKMTVPRTHAGLGVEPNWEVLKNPMFVIS